MPILFHVPCTPFVPQGILLVNNSDRDLKWAVDVTKGNQALEEGVFKFLHPSGMPFITHPEGGVEGTLQPGQTQTLGVIFCPSQYLLLYRFLRYFYKS